MVRDDKMGDMFVIEGMERPIPMGLLAAAGKTAKELAIGRREVRGPASRRMGSRGADGRSGSRRRGRRDHLSHRRHAALQPSGLRLQEGLLRRVQPVDRRVLRGASGSPDRHRPDRDALGRGRHRGSAQDEGAGTEGRDDAGQSRGRGLRQPGLRRLFTRRRSTSRCR